MTDSNGNRVAVVVGGPNDGDVWFIGDNKDGDFFMPMKTAEGRPIYRLIGDRWEFHSYEHQHICGWPYEQMSDTDD